MSESALEARLKKWDPDARGDDYRPFIRAGRALGVSKAYRIPHPCCRRELNLVSQLEYRGTIQLMYQHRGPLADVLEQYALPRGHTLEAARRLGVRHQVYPRTDLDLVMTTDLVLVLHIREREVLQPVSFKYAKEFKGKSRAQVRCKEVMDIERAAWRARGIDCWTFTDEDIHLVLFHNLKFLDVWKCTVGLVHRRLNARAIIPEFMKLWKADATLEEILVRCGRRLGISRDEAFLYFAECAWHGWLPVNLMAYTLALYWPVPLLKERPRG